MSLKRIRRPLWLTWMKNVGCFFSFSGHKKLYEKKIKKLNILRVDVIQFANTQNWKKNSHFYLFISFVYNRPTFNLKFHIRNSLYLAISVGRSFSSVVYFFLKT